MLPPTSLAQLPGQEDKSAFTYRAFTRAELSTFPSVCAALLLTEASLGSRAP